MQNPKPYTVTRSLSSELFSHQKVHWASYVWLPHDDNNKITRISVSGAQFCHLHTKEHPTLQAMPLETRDIKILLCVRGRVRPCLAACKRLSPAFSQLMQMEFFRGQNQAIQLDHHQKEKQNLRNIRRVVFVKNWTSPQEVERDDHRQGFYEGDTGTE